LLPSQQKSHKLLSYDVMRRAVGELQTFF
jgi:hypothetical protein